MDNLIKALQIFLKYGNPTYPTHCEHDTLWICGIRWGDISTADQVKLIGLGFFYDKDDDAIQSFRFGSA